MNKLILLILVFSVNTVLSQGVDTLVVYQNDTTVFDITGSFVQWPCSKPEFHISYDLKDPKDSTFYIIYNDEEQLVEEGIYSSRLIGGVEYSDFFDSKYYHYHKNGKLYIVYFKEDGRTVKAEFYNKRGKFKKVKIY